MTDRGWLVPSDYQVMTDGAARVKVWGQSEEASAAALVNATTKLVLLSGAKLDAAPGGR